MRTSARMAASRVEPTADRKIHPAANPETNAPTVLNAMTEVSSLWKHVEQLPYLTSGNRRRRVLLSSACFSQKGDAARYVRNLDESSERIVEATTATKPVLPHIGLAPTVQ